MPKNATIEERNAWRKEHLKNCEYRTDYPKKLNAEMKKLKMTKSTS